MTSILKTFIIVFPSKRRYIQCQLKLRRYCISVKVPCRFLIIIVALCASYLDEISTCKRYILTDGPGVGKTTIINILNKQGYQTTPEAYNILYNEAKQDQTLSKFFADGPAKHQTVSNT